MSSQRKHEERDRRIIEAVNNGGSFSSVGNIFNVSPSTIAGAVWRARERGEKITAKSRGKKSRKAMRSSTPAKDGSRVSKDDLPIDALRKAVREGRAQWNAKRWGECLPDTPAQCRWPIGDFTNPENPLHFCAAKRKRHEISLAKEQYPYCEYHERMAKVPLRAKTASASKKSRIVVSRYSNRYAKAA